MSETSPPPLAEQVAAVAAELRLAAARRTEEFGPIAAIQALILATLARIFTTLAGMVALWQAGLLPPLTPRRPSAAPRPHVLSLASAPALHPRAQRQRHHIAPESPIPTVPQPAPSVRPTPIGASAPAPILAPVLAPYPRHPSHAALARAPPWPTRSKPPEPQPPPHANFVTIS